MSSAFHRAKSSPIQIHIHTHGHTHLHTHKRPLPPVNTLWHRPRITNTHVQLQHDKYAIFCPCQNTQPWHWEHWKHWAPVWRYQVITGLLPWARPRLKPEELSDLLWDRQIFTAVSLWFTCFNKKVVDPHYVGLSGRNTEVNKMLVFRKASMVVNDYDDINKTLQNDLHFGTVVKMFFFSFNFLLSQADTNMMRNMRGNIGRKWQTSFYSRLINVDRYSAALIQSILGSGILLILLLIIMATGQNVLVVCL